MLYFGTWTYNTDFLIVESYKYMHCTIYCIVFNPWNNSMKYVCIKNWLNWLSFWKPILFKWSWVSISVDLIIHSFTGCVNSSTAVLMNDETCCHRSYFDELLNITTKFMKNEVLGILMKHQFIQNMFMHLAYHFHGILVNQLYTYTYNY